MTIFTFASFLKISWITFDFSFFLNVCHSFNLCGLLGGYRFTCESILTLFWSLLFTKSKTTQGGRGMFTCLLSKGVDSSRKGVFFFLIISMPKKKFYDFISYISSSLNCCCVWSGDCITSGRMEYLTAVYFYLLRLSRVVYVIQWQSINALRWAGEKVSTFSFVFGHCYLLFVLKLGARWPFGSYSLFILFCIIGGTAAAAAPSLVYKQSSLYIHGKSCRSNCFPTWS